MNRSPPSRKRAEHERADPRAPGIRGADARGIFRLILARGLKLSAIGLAIGLAATLALSRVLSSLLFEISPQTIDKWTSQRIDTRRQ